MNDQYANGKNVYAVKLPKRGHPKNAVADDELAGKVKPQAGRKSNPFRGLSGKKGR